MHGDETDATPQPGPDTAPDPVAPARPPLPRPRPSADPAVPFVAVPAAPPVSPVPAPQAPLNVAEPVAFHRPLPAPAALPAGRTYAPRPYPAAWSESPVSAARSESAAAPVSPAYPVPPRPPAGPFPPRMGNTGQHPIIPPQAASAAPHRPLPGEPTGQFRTGPFPPGQSQPAWVPPAQSQAGQSQPGGSHTGQFRTGQFETDRSQTGQFGAGQFRTGQFGAGTHLGVPSPAGPQMYAPPVPHQRRPYPGPQQPGQGHLRQPSAPYPPQPPRQGRFRLTGLRVALLAALALVLVTPPAAIAFETVRRERTITAVPGGVPSGKAPGQSNGKPGATGTPPAGNPASVDGKVKQALADQGKALLAGDAAGFVAAVDPAAATLRADLTKRFNSLRQLQVKVWEPSVLDAVKVGSDNTADVIVYVKYCYVVDTCDPMNLETKTRWSVTAAGVKILDFGVADELGPRPFERSDLRVMVGKRVVMATTPKYASRLTTMLNAAEKAAELADRYSKWSPPPSRYVVYLAGPEEWSTWYGIKQESWVAGFALPLTPDATEIVLNANRVDIKETLDVLRHEFTHVVTLLAVSRAYDQTWWLVEGIAEYVRVQGLNGRFDDTSSVRKYVQSGRWKNEIAMDDPPEGATSADVSGRYGVAYMSVQRMADRFGEDKMLEFFDQTARQGLALQDAATKVYGVSWDDVATDCVKYVRNHV